jgi:hypothetical protein
LQEKRAELARRGLGLAVITYDSPAVLRHFAERRGIAYPMLSDSGSKVIRAFGILNPNIPAGTPFHGVPFPGTYIVDARGVVRSKYFEDDYRERVTAGSILLREFRADGGTVAEVRTRHATIRASATNDTVFAGSRITLAIDVELPRGMHVYAPGVEGYKPIAWTLAPTKGVLLLDPAYPPSRMLRLKAIGETVPVYENRVRATRDLVIGMANELGPAAMKDGVVVEGALQYQACDAKVCYPPESVPLRWRFAVQPPDRDRVPAALRDKVQ